MLKEIKTSSFQIYQCIFKSITFTEYENSLDKKSKQKLLLKLSFYSYIISFFVVLTIRVISFYLFKIPFNWTDLLNIAIVIAVFIAIGIVPGITIGIAPSIAFSIVLGIAFGTGVGITGGIAFGIVGIFIFGIALGITSGIAEGISFFVFYSRIFYVFPHLIQYFRAKSSNESIFRLFKHSPIYWDEIINYPLPFLTNFLVMLTEVNRAQGIAEIEFVSSKRPTQRKKAFNALLEITIKDLSKLESIESISDASGNISFLSSFEGFLPKEFSKTLRVVDDLSIDANNYLNSSSDFNRLKNLNNLESDILDFKKSLIAIKGPVGSKFLSLTEKWSQIVEEEKKQITRSNSDNYEEVPNPYIFGNPVRVDDASRLFVGRKDVVDLIKSNLTSNISPLVIG